MNYKHLIVSIILIILFTSCDPTHSLKLENNTSDKIEVLYYPSLRNVPNNQRVLSYYGYQEVYIHNLEQGKYIEIGNVVARYNPKPNDIDLDFLEVRLGTDTIRFIGKNAIFSMINKVENLDWRISIK